jgi:predicted dinucleotide-binding enzyme
MLKNFETVYEALTYWYNESINMLKNRSKKVYPSVDKAKRYRDDDADLNDRVLIECENGEKFDLRIKDTYQIDGKHIYFKVETTKKDTTVKRVTISFKTVKANAVFKGKRLTLIFDRDVIFETDEAEADKDIIKLIGCEQII